MGALDGSDFKSFVGMNDPRGLEGIIMTDGDGVGEPIFIVGGTIGSDDGRELGLDDGIPVGTKEGEYDGCNLDIGRPAFEDGVVVVASGGGRKVCGADGVTVGFKGDEVGGDGIIRGEDVGCNLDIGAAVGRPVFEDGGMDGTAV